jgi:hypothetical protein
VSFKKKKQDNGWADWEWLTGRRTNPTAFEFFSNLLRCKKVRLDIEKKYNNFSKMAADVKLGVNKQLWR